MSCASSEEFIKELYDYAASQGLSKDVFLNASTIDGYIEASVDAYRGYPLFTQIFDGGYDAKTLSRMMKIDLKSRIKLIGGITGSDNYESVILIEPPKAKKTGMLQYFGVASPGDYTLLLKSSMHKQEKYEKFALENRREYLDDKTWYLYIFATKKEYQRSGYGKKLMNLILSFADEKGYRICLETNLTENVTMYENFGFKKMKSMIYKENLEHYVMLYGG